MKLSAAESTRAIVDVDGVPCRVWVAITEDGLPCYLLVHRVAIDESRGRSLSSIDLREMQPPIDLRACSGGGPHE